MGRGGRGSDLQVPLAHGGRVDEQLGEVEVVGERDPPLLQLLLPVGQQQIPELLVEGARVGQERRGQQHVAWKTGTGRMFTIFSVGNDNLKMYPFTDSQIRAQKCNMERIPFHHCILGLLPH